jgi:hypothetical protein
LSAGKLWKVAFQRPASAAFHRLKSFIVTW